MFDTFLYAFNAVTPMLLLMLLGWGMKAAKFFDDNLLKRMNSFTFRFGISAMMFRNIYSLSSLREIHLDSIWFVLATCLVLTGLGWVEAHIFTDRRERRGIMIQNSFRSNFAIIGTTLAFSLGGAAGGAVSASIQAPAIIYYNEAAVLFLTIYSDQSNRAVDVGGILKKIATNPMILGQVAGLICLVLREFIPRDAQGELVFSLSGSLPFLYSAVESLADMASPLILILLGARVNFSAVGGLKKELVVGVVQRLIVAPAVGFGMVFLADSLGLFTVTPAVLSALVGMYGSPVASASAVMAEEMGGDAELARQYVVWTSAFSMGTLFLWIFLLRKSGGQWRFAHHVDGFGESGSMFEEDTLGRIWFSHWMKGIYKLTLNDGLTAFDSVELLDTTKGFYSLRNNFVFKVRDRLLFSGDGGFFTYDEAMDRMTHCAEAEVAFGRNPYGVKLVESPDGNIWVLTNTDLQLARKQPGGQYDIDRQTFAEMKDKMIPGFEQFYFVNDSNLIINTDEGFAWIDLDKAKHPHPALKVSIHSLHLTSRQDSLAAGYIARQQEVPEYDYRDNSLRFEYAAPEYESPASVTYSCLLENYDNDWSRYTHANAKEYTKLPQGDYVFRVRAQSGVDGQQAETSFRFTILPPWYLSPAAYGVYAVLLLAMLYAAVLLVKRHSQKSALKVKEQKEREMREQEQRFLEEKKMQQQEITKLKNQKLQYELRHKSRDLANSTMNVIRKNEILLDINNNLVKIADDIRSEKHPAELLKHIERVQDDIRKNIERDDNWKKFETNFDIVYENYLKRLGTDYPALTVSDKKLCAYLKMGLSSKDIAPLLNMSFRSVEMSRYRLRKKLNLNRNVNLTEFLQSY